MAFPLSDAVDFLARPFVCHPDQVSEAQAEANARSDRREAIRLKRAGKKKSPSAALRASAHPR